MIFSALDAFATLNSDLTRLASTPTASPGSLLEASYPLASRQPKQLNEQIVTKTRK